MIEDKLTKQELLKMVGGNRFETEAAFKDFIKPKIREALAISPERLAEEDAATASDDKRYDLYVRDKETGIETLVLIGLKTVKTVNALTEADFEIFHRYCQDTKARYSALMTEQECHLYHYKKGEAGLDIIEINEFPPLNHIDYEFERELTPEKVKDILISHKWTVVTVLIFLLFFMAMSLARITICANSGAIKGNINEDGQKIYYMPNAKGYDKIVIGDVTGERRFCDEQKAISNGWIKSENGSI